MSFPFFLESKQKSCYKVTHFEITPHLIQVYVCETLYRVAVNLIVLLGQVRTTRIRRGGEVWKGAQIIGLPQTEKLIDLNLSNKLSLSQKRVLG